MPARAVVIDKEAYWERYALLYEAAESEDRLSAEALIQISQQANREAGALPFSLAATALANGDDGPAKELCRREMRIHGRQWALELWQAIKEAVAESLQ